MKIGIDVSPLSSGHNVRGIGFYLTHLLIALKAYCPENEYVEFNSPKNMPKDADLIHYPYFDPFFLTLPFFKTKKVAITVHDLTPILFSDLFPSGLKGGIKWWFQKRALQKADAIITDSISSQKDIAKIISISEKKIHIVHLAAGQEFKQIPLHNIPITKIKQKYHLPDTFVLYVGDVTPNKNLPRLVKATLRANIPLVMVGKALSARNIDRMNLWNKDLIEVQELAKGNPRVIRLGFIPTDDLVVLYNIANAFAMPSLYEGFGLPILEAMSCGCPVITTREGSLPEVAGEAAYMVDAYSIDSIAEGLQKVIGDKQLQKKLIVKGFAQSKRFSWVKTAKKTVQVYKNIIGRI